MTPDDVRSRLQRLEDRELIRELPVRYAWHAARADAQELTALFTKDGSIDLEGTKRRGSAELYDFFSTLTPWHVIPLVSNQIIELQGGVASGSCKMMSPWQGELSGFCGVYLDEYRRDGGRWKFMSRKWTRHRPPGPASA